MTSITPDRYKKIYLAGPDVFFPNPVAVGENLKSIARRYGFDPMFPFDNIVSPDDPDPSRTIFDANALMIHEAYFIVANLNPFRGAEPDSGTVFEVGFAKAQGKFVVGYTANNDSMVDRVLRMESRKKPSTGPYLDAAGQSIEDFGHPVNLMLAHGLDHLVIGDFEDAIKYLKTIIPANSSLF